MINSVGLELKDYAGSASTLCTGCGHDSVTKNIMAAYFQSGVHPFQVAKLSGIGCSSKTPAYFMNQSHGFNSIHGRMASVATGARVANHNLEILGISGDGDTASIGLGGFIHLLRRNVKMVYIIENNGVYGLTKGQFSATADLESVQKSGEVNPFQSVDLCSLAIEAGCGFVARSFSGDNKQLISLIDAAIRHPGTALIDVISPCITYANNDGSTRSYDYVKEHKVALQELGFIQPKAETLLTEADSDGVSRIEMADGSYLTLKSLAADHDIHDSASALKTMREFRNSDSIVTGLFYLSKNLETLEQKLNLCAEPLAQLKEKDLRLSANFLDKTLDHFR
ncbi:MAG: thiamine pyrophosphate-dependent enzyme [Bdellovibrionota bacterium]